MRDEMFNQCWSNWWTGVTMAQALFVFLIGLLYLHTSEQEVIVKYSVDVVNPISTTGNWTERIPRECIELGFCAESQDYPKDLADSLSDLLPKQNVILDSFDTSDSSDSYDSYGGFFSLDREYRFPVLLDRSGFGDDKENPCKYMTKVIAPKMVKDYVSGKWYYVVNSNDNPLQLYNTKRCVRKSFRQNASHSCQNIIPHPDYNLQCIQKYMVRKIYVIDSGNMTSISWTIPSCCTCVAVHK